MTSPDHVPGQNGRLSYSLAAELDPEGLARIEAILCGDLTRLANRIQKTRLTELPAELVSELDARNRVWLDGLFSAAMPKNTRLAYERDLRYFWIWFGLRYSGRVTQAPFYPIERGVVINFILDHTGAMDPGLEHALRNTVVYENGTRRHVLKKHDGPWKPSTLHRRLSAISRMHRDFPRSNPTRDPDVRVILTAYEKALAQSAAEAAVRNEHDNIACRLSETTKKSCVGPRPS